MELTAPLQRIRSVRSFSSSFEEDESRSVTELLGRSSLDSWSRLASLSRLWEFLSSSDSVGSAWPGRARLVAQYTTVLSHLEDGSCICAEDDEQITVRLEPEASRPIDLRISKEPRDFRVVLEPRDR